MIGGSTEIYVDEEEHGTVTFVTAVEGAGAGVDVKEFGTLVVELIKVGTGRVGSRPSVGMETSDIIVELNEDTTRKGLL